MTLAPRIVHNRVDALVLAFRVTILDDTRTLLRRHADVAAVHGRVAAHVADLDWELRAGSVPSVFNLRRDQHVRVRIDLNAAGATLTPSVDSLGHAIVEAQAGWTVELVAYAAHLASVGEREVFREMFEIARKLGRVHECRMRRIDFAADVNGWALRDKDRRAFVRRSRVRTSIYSPAPDGYDLRAPATDKSVRASATAHETRQITGFTVGRGDVVARIYDKREELNLDASKHKAPAEEERWKKGGWDGESGITRVEFQIRGEALKELGARTILDDAGTLAGAHDESTGELMTLWDQIPRMWASMRLWLRLVERKKTRTGRAMPLTRCPDDPRWAVLESASWGKAPAIHRKRERGGASSAQALGSMLSVAAARGKLKGELCEDRKNYETGSVEKLRALLTVLGGWSTDLIASDLIDRWGSCEEACVHVAILWNAARARFARMLEKKEKIPWQIGSKLVSTELEELRAVVKLD